MVIAWPRHYECIARAARSLTFLWSFEPDSVKALVKWRATIWQSNKDISSRRKKRSSSGSTQFLKQSQGPHLSIRDAARFILRRILTKNQHFTNGILSTAENKAQSRRATEVIPQRCIICERKQQRSTGRHLASIASPARINCVRNKERKTIISLCQPSSLRHVSSFSPLRVCVRIYIQNDQPTRSDDT